jgi:hypothetical protein
MSATERSALERDLEVVSRADAAVAQLLALDARIDGEAAQRLGVMRDQVAVGTVRSCSSSAGWRRCRRTRGAGRRPGARDVHAHRERASTT